MQTAWTALLAEAGIVWTDNAQAQLNRYLEQLREYNAYASLVSQGDLALLETVHVPDSLSLVPYVRSHTQAGGSHLDIGTGSGFPAIPIAIALPELPMTLVERSTKKVGYLRQVIGALGLSQLRLVQGEFPMAVAGQRFSCVTARAVERAEKIGKALTPFIADGAVFLDQSGAPSAKQREMFHVEHVLDAWTASGLRRGDLYAISRRA